MDGSPTLSPDSLRVLRRLRDRVNQSYLATPDLTMRHVMRLRVGAEANRRDAIEWEQYAKQLTEYPHVLASGSIHQGKAPITDAHGRAEFAVLGNRPAENEFRIFMDECKIDLVSHVSAALQGADRGLAQRL